MVFLIGEFAVRVASEEGRTDLWKQLHGDELETGLQGVANLKNSSKYKGTDNGYQEV